MLPLLTTHEHQSAATSMREAITIEYIVLLMMEAGGNEVEDRRA